jgi:hypothetical protein
MIVASIIGVVLAILISIFVALNPILFGLDTGLTTREIFVFDKHVILDGQLEILAAELGDHFDGYRNHCLRTLTFARFFLPKPVFDLYPNVLDVISVALAFHDLGTWTDVELDYRNASAAQMEYRVRREGVWDEDTIRTMRQIILGHHEINEYTGGETDVINDIVNAVRKADWVDSTMGVIRYDMPAPLLEAAYHTNPDLHFHRRALQVSLGKFWSF